MGGKKRSRNDDDYYIMKKIRRLEKEVKRRRRRSLSSSDSDEYQRGSISSDEQFYDDVFFEDEAEVEEMSSTPALAANPAVVPTLQELPAATSNETEEGLDREILDILGDDPSTENPYGEDLNKEVASRWENILLNGLSKENRTELQKLYLPSQNCPHMKAPKLNAEIKAALTELSNKKDTFSQSRQNQLTGCLSAIGKVLNIVLSKKANMPQEIIKPLSDAGRLLCDYHHKQSLSRRYAAMNTLSKQTRDTIKNAKIDDFLFGADLAEQLKSSKAISKSGMEMRPPVAGPSGIKKPASTISRPPLAARRAPTLNARGAPRAPAAEPRANPGPRRPAPAPRRYYSSGYKTAPPRRRSRRQ